MLSAHPFAALEYWFFKVNSGPVALLVDWIAVRKAGEHRLRVSIQSPHGREVLFGKLAESMPTDNFLSAQHTAGQLGEVAWDLEIQPGADWIKPDVFPIGLLQVGDLSIVSAPRATFSGWIRHGSQRVTLQNEPGVVSHYWGRQLAAEWWWVSASRFDSPGVAVECIVARSAVWGSRMQIPFAYLYLRDADGRTLLMAPPNRVQVHGSPERFQIEFTTWGGRTLRLACTGRDYGDLGQGIVNTLTGDLEVHENGRLIARARGTAGLERRPPQPAGT